MTLFKSRWKTVAGILTAAVLSLGAGTAWATDPLAIDGNPRKASSGVKFSASVGADTFNLKIGGVHQSRNLTWAADSGNVTPTKFTVRFATTAAGGGEISGINGSTLTPIAGSDSLQLIVKYTATTTSVVKDSTIALFMFDSAATDGSKSNRLTGPSGATLKITLTKKLVSADFGALTNVTKPTVGTVIAYGTPTLASSGAGKYALAKVTTGDSVQRYVNNGWTGVVNGDGGTHAALPVTQYRYQYTVTPVAATAASPTGWGWDLAALPDWKSLKPADAAACSLLVRPNAAAEAATIVIRYAATDKGTLGADALGAPTFVQDGGALTASLTDNGVPTGVADGIVTASGQPVVYGYKKDGTTTWTYLAAGITKTPALDAGSKYTFRAKAVSTTSYNEFEGTPTTAVAIVGTITAKPTIGISTAPARGGTIPTGTAAGLSLGSNAATNHYGTISVLSDESSNPAESGWWMRSPGEEEWTNIASLAVQNGISVKYLANRQYRVKVKITAATNWKFNENWSDADIASFAPVAVGRVTEGAVAADGEYITAYIEFPTTAKTPITSLTTDDILWTLDASNDPTYPQQPSASSESTSAGDPKYLIAGYADDATTWGAASISVVDGGKIKGGGDDGDEYVGYERVYWVKLNANGGIDSYVPYASDAKFEPNTTYGLLIGLVPAEDYVFGTVSTVPSNFRRPTGSSANASIVAKPNGWGTDWGDPDAGLFILIPYTKTKAVVDLSPSNGVAISAAPVQGAKISDTKFTKPASAVGYKIGAVAWFVINENHTDWVTDGDATTAFKPDTQYLATVELKTDPAASYFFDKSDLTELADQVSAFYDGNAAVDSVSLATGAAEDLITLRIAFAKTGKLKVSLTGKIAIPTISSGATNTPTAGSLMSVNSANPPNDFKPYTVPQTWTSGASGAVEVFKWLALTSEDTSIVEYSATSKYGFGTTYGALLQILPPDGKEFPAFSSVTNWKTFLPAGPVDIVDYWDEPSTAEKLSIVVIWPKTKEEIKAEDVKLSGAVQPKFGEKKWSFVSENPAIKVGTTAWATVASNTPSALTASTFPYLPDGTTLTATVPLTALGDNAFNADATDLTPFVSELIEALVTAEKAAVAPLTVTNATTASLTVTFSELAPGSIPAAALTGIVAPVLGAEVTKPTASSIKFEGLITGTSKNATVAITGSASGWFPVAEDGTVGSELVASASGARVYFGAEKKYALGVSITPENAYTFGEDPDAESIAAKYIPAGATLGEGDGLAAEFSDAGVLTFYVVYPAFAQPTLSGSAALSVPFSGTKSVTEGGVFDVAGLTLVGASAAANVVLGKDRDTPPAEGHDVVVTDRHGEELVDVAVHGITVERGSTFDKATGAAGSSAPQIKIAPAPAGLTVDRSPYTVAFSLFSEALNINARTTGAITLTVTPSNAATAGGTIEFSASPNVSGASGVGSIVYSAPIIAPADGVLRTPSTAAFGAFELIGWLESAGGTLGDLGGALQTDGVYKAGRIYVAVIDAVAADNYSFSGSTPAQLASFVSVAKGSGQAELGDKKASATALLTGPGFGVSDDGKTLRFGIAYNYVAQPRIAQTQANKAEVFRFGAESAVIAVTPATGPGALLTAAAGADYKVTLTSAEANGPFAASVTAGGDTISIDGGISALQPKKDAYAFNVQIADANFGIDTTIAATVKIGPRYVIGDDLAGIPIPVLGASVWGDVALTAGEGAKDVASASIVGWTKALSATSSNLLATGTAFASGQDVYAIIKIEAAAGTGFNPAKTAAEYATDFVGRVNGVSPVAVTSLANVVPDVGTNGFIADASGTRTALVFGVYLGKVGQPTITAANIPSYPYGTADTSVTLTFPNGFPTSLQLTAAVTKGGTAAAPVPVALSASAGGAVTGRILLTGLSATNVATTAIAHTVNVWNADSSIFVQNIPFNVTVVRAEVSAKPIAGTIAAPTILGAIAAPTGLTAGDNTDLAAANAVTSPGWRNVTAVNASGGITGVASANRTSGSFAADSVYVAVVKVQADANHKFVNTPEKLAQYAQAYRGAIGSGVVVGASAATDLVASGTSSDVLTFGIYFAKTGQAQFSATPVTDFIYGTATVPVTLKVDPSIALTIPANGISAKFGDSVLTVTGIAVASAAGADGKRDITFTLGKADLLTAGTQTVALTINANNNVKGTTSLGVTVTPRSLTTGVTANVYKKGTTAAATFSYTGASFKDSVDVRVVFGTGAAAKTLALTTDYTLTYPGLVNAGTDSVKIKGAGNWKDSLVAKPVVINKVTPAALTVLRSTDTLDWAATINLANRRSDWFSAPTLPDEIVYYSVNGTVYTPIENGQLSLANDTTGKTVRIGVRQESDNLNLGAYSGLVTLTILAKDAPKVTVSGFPADITIVENHPRGTLKVTAAGANLPAGGVLKYQWYIKREAATSFSTAGNGRDSLVLADVGLVRTKGVYEAYADVWADGAKVVSTKSRLAKVTVRDADFTAAPAVATLNFSNQTAVFTTGGQFRVANPTVTPLQPAAGTVAANYKLVKIVYELDNAVAAQASDEVEIKTADLPSVAKVGKYAVTATVRNTAEGSVGWGLEATKTVDFEVTPRAISNVTVTVTPLTGNDAVYDGKQKDIESRVIVTDGAGKTLVPGDEYDIVEPKAWTNAGTDTVWVEGKGNYSGKKAGTFVIAKRAIAFDKDAVYTEFFTRRYNGTADITVNDGFEIKFTGVVEGENLTRGTDYTVTGLKFNSKDVGNKTVSATVALVAAGEKAKNYSLADGKFASVGVIEKGEATADDFKSLGLPKTVLYNGKTQTPGTLSWASGVDNKQISGDKEKDGKFSVLYNGASDLPLAVGTYAVTVQVNEGQSFLRTESIPLGDFIIAAAYEPIVTVSPTDTTIRETYNAVLTATAYVLDTAGNQITKGITYQWYTVSTVDGVADAKTANGTNATVTIKDLKEGQYSFYVEATYKNSNQATTTKKSASANVTVGKAPVSIETATVVIGGDYVYTGTRQVIDPNNISVTLAGQPLSSGTDYTFATSSSEAGTGVVTITAVEGSAYKGTKSGTFNIAKKQLAAEDLTFDPPKEYTGSALGANVRLVSPLRGSGAITVLYEGAASVPTNAGTYKLSVTVDTGSNLFGVALPEFGSYTILPVTPTVDMFTFDKITDVPWTGAPQSIGTVTAKKFATEMGKLTVLYNGNETAPVDSMIEYAVDLVVEGGQNVTGSKVELGKFTIRGKDYVSVLAGNREIPGGASVEQAAVAPVKAVSAQVTFGPNPVKANGNVSVYWSGSKPVQGKLYVFNSVGSKVAAVAVKGTGKVGTWNASGASEGTYLVKGVLKTANGDKVKVSAVVGVAR